MTAIESGSGPDLSSTKPAPGHVMYVCTGCNFSKTLAEKRGKRGGNVLWHAIANEIAKRGGVPVHIEPVACLSVCKDSCAVALTAHGKYTYTFGWVRPEAQSAADLLDAAALYVASGNGHIDRPLRPAATQRLISKVPPPDVDPNVDDDSRNPRVAEQVPKPPRRC